MNQNIKYQKKGMALIVSVIMCTVLLLIATTIANISIKESQMTVRTDVSTTAYNNARTGLEWALYYIKAKEELGVYAGGGPYSFTTTYGTYSVTIGAKVGSTRNIDSVGVFNSVQRKIHYDLVDNDESTIACASNSFNIAGGSTINDSFNLQFDFSIDDPAQTTTVSINGTSGDLYLQKVGGSNYINLGYSIGAGAPVYPASGQISVTALSSQLNNPPLKFRAYIHYIKNIAAELRIEYRDTVNNELTCSANGGGSGYVSVVGQNFGNFSTVTVDSGVCDATTGYLDSGTKFSLTNVVRKLQY